MGTLCGSISDFMANNSKPLVRDMVKRKYAIRVINNPNAVIFDLVKLLCEAIMRLDHNETVYTDTMSGNISAFMANNSNPSARHMGKHGILLGLLFFHTKLLCEREVQPGHKQLGSNEHAVR